MSAIALIGAGNVGLRLAHLLADAQHQPVFGVRNPGKTADAEFPEVTIEEAIRQAEIVLLTLPCTACAHLLPTVASLLAGKIVVDVTNPLNEDWSPLQLQGHVSGAEVVARLLPESKVVKAFNTIFADIMSHEGIDRDGRSVTAFIASDHTDAASAVVGLAVDMGFAPCCLDGLHTARYLEAIAHLNIHIAVNQGGGTNAAFIFDQQK